MPRTELDRRLDALRAALVDMGDAVEASIGQAVDALCRRDHAQARAVIAGDDGIDRQCAIVEEMCAQVIPLQQPAVGDLRAVLAAMAIAEELERIGDHAEGIAQLALRLPAALSDAEMRALAALAALARVQVQGAIDAYRACDVTRARTVWADDRTVDALYRRLVQSVLAAMGQDQEALLVHTYVLWVAHNLERIADRATNVCERVVFIATGQRTIMAAC